MLPLNPYQSPGPLLESAGTLYYVNPAKLSLSEHLRTTSSTLQAHWNWLTWNLGLRWGGFPTVRAFSLAETKCTLEAIPDFVQAFLVERIELATREGFYGVLPSLTWDQNVYPVEMIVRMLHSDPQIYLEMCLLRCDGFYLLKHNLVSVAKVFRTFATSSGSPAIRRPPMCEANYLPDAPLPVLLESHVEWIQNCRDSLRELREPSDIEDVVQQLDDHYRQFQIERGYWIPLESKS